MTTSTDYRDMMATWLNNSCIRDQHIRRELNNIATKADASTNGETDEAVLSRDHSGYQMD